MNFCSNCGEKVTFKQVGYDPIQRFYCENCNTVHYQNPKVVAGCVVTHKNKVLLCKRAIPPRYGYWNIPAGYFENGETVADGAAREVWEETNSKVAISHLHCLYDIKHVNQLYVIFVAQLLDLNFGPTTESLEVQLFEEHQIPWQDIAFSSTVFALKTYFKNKKNNSTKVHIGAYDLKAADSQ